MILLESSDRLVVLFGTGLVGSAIHRGLLPWRAWRTRELPNRWNDAGQLRRDLDQVARLVEASQARAPRPIHWVWSAGRCGFGANQADIGEELAVFRQVIELMRQVRAATGSPTRLTLTSSLGGLFEGQRHVDRGSLPRPLRPYGELKLAQEQRVGELSGIHGHIYRLPTVYGRLRVGQRMGLVSTMIANGLSQRVTRIYGRADTLRDFVHADDIGHFIARRILADEGDQELPEILASGRPASILEIRVLVERILGRRIQVSFEISKENASNITVAPSVLPEDWRPRALETGLRGVLRMI